MRTVTALSLAVLLACGCAGGPAAQAADAPRASFPDKAYKLKCGNEAFEIHFTDMEAHLTLQGGMSLLKRLPGGPAAYSNGRMTFTRSGDTITYARGRAAAVKCVNAGADAAAEEHHH